MATLLKIESYSCESLNDTQHCELHKAILKLVSSTVNSGLPDLPPNLYWSYKGYVNIESKLCQKINAIPKQKQTSLDVNAMNEILQDARNQTDKNFFILRQWIELIHQSNIPNKEHDKLVNLMDGINRIILNN